MMFDRLRDYDAFSKVFEEEEQVVREEVNMNREQVNVINYHVDTLAPGVSQQLFELDGFRFEVTFLRTNTVWHITGMGFQPDGTGDGTLINIVVPHWHRRSYIVDLIERTIVEHVSYRK